MQAHGSGRDCEVRSRLHAKAIEKTKYQRQGREAESGRERRNARGKRSNLRNVAGVVRGGARRRFAKSLKA